MIPADAIADALDQADTREIERAFRALVAFPDGEEVGGPFTAERLDDLLGRVAEALRPYQITAPAAVLEAVQDRMGLPVPLGTWMSYGEVALLVQRYRDRWREAFVAHMGGWRGKSKPGARRPTPG